MAIYVANTFVDQQFGLSFVRQFCSWLGLVMSLLSWLDTVGWSQLGQLVAALHSLLTFQEAKPWGSY